MKLQIRRCLLPLVYAETFELAMPEGARCLSVVASPMRANTTAKATLFILADLDNREVMRTFALMKSGQDLPPEAKRELGLPEKMVYVSSFITINNFNMPVDYHLFEVL